ncbi:MAG: ATP-binding cassette domain-containing protein [Candidatus Cohnella colombiensis]|uniref:ATP-binding cassette domain-containing protein n=1 Tax=Candidatus Cohnella colombiensis TaxID=3121368 RepID=A0AA95JFX5_9BACL|nr:MAG: ATP-binding cassette domain-containing protein [Cohnella sp.]
MAHFEIKQLTFTYPHEESPALRDVTLTVKPGEFVVLCGPSGSGKSTLMRLLKREVSPGGRLSGAILLDGTPLHEWDAAKVAARVGLVMQNPDSQLVVDTVEHELAFGMENFGLERDVMRRRMAEMAGFFGLEPLLKRSTDELSGGQKQLVNLAAVLMLQPKVLLLDEPMAQLDPLAARELLVMIKRLSDEWGITVIMSEHRIDELLPIVDRVVRLEKGEVVFNGHPRDFVKEAWARRSEQWDIALPSITRWALTHNEAGEPPLTVKEARDWMLLHHVNPVHLSERDTEASNVKATELLCADQLFFAYEKHMPAVLKGLEWQVREGDWLALFGGNGSGKSTLMQLLAGLRFAQRGQVLLQGTAIKRIKEKTRFATIGYLAQNPVLHFAHESLLDDLLAAARRAGTTEQEARELVERFGLTRLLTRHPHDLSGGEQQLGALAITLLSKPKLLLLDEPTKGLDPLSKQKLASHLQSIHANGTTLVMATHDVEFAATYVNRCSLLFDGEIVADGAPESFFHGNLFYATPLHRLMEQISSVGDKEVQHT